MRTLFSLLVSVSLFLAISSIGTDAFAVTADQQITTASSLVQLQNQVNRSAVDVTNQLKKVRNSKAAQSNAAALARTLRAYNQQLDQLNLQMTRSKPTMAAVVNKTPAEDQQLKAELKESADSSLLWFKHMSVHMSQVDRLKGLKNLGDDFWNATRPEIAELERAIFGTIAWMNQPPPQSVLDFFATQVEWLKRFGSEKVVEVNVANSDKASLEVIRNEIAAALGAGVQSVTFLSPIHTDSKIVFAPVNEFDVVVNSITAAKVSRQDEQQRTIWVGTSGDATAGGGEIKFVINGTETYSDLFECLRAIWRDETTGKFSRGRSQGGSTRGTVKFGGSVQAFADQVNFGTVQSVNESSRSIVIKADPAKLNAGWVIASLEGIEGSSAAEARAELAEYARRQKTESSVEAIEEKLGMSRRDRIRSRSRRSRPGSESAALLAAIEQLGAPIEDSVLTDTEIAELAEAMHNESFFDGQSRERAAAILLTVNPGQVADKKIIGRVARGYRKLVLDEAFPDGELVQGLVLWGGKHSVRYLIEILKDGNGRTNAEVFAGLLKYETPEAAKAVAWKLEDIFDRDMAVEYLRRTKHFPEETIIAIAPSRNTKVSLAAIELLGEFGSKKSLSLLRRADKSRDAEVRQAAAEATRMVKERLASAGP